MAVVLVIVIAAAAVLVVYLTRRTAIKDEEQELKAAAVLIKEQQLRNAIDMNRVANNEKEQLVLVITWKEEKKEKFIFLPSLGVRIGRGREENQICIPLETVSLKHCMIFSNGDNIYVQDLNSANGTFIKRGNKTFRVTDYALCEENDTIIIGGISFKIRSFWAPSTYL